MSSATPNESVELDHEIVDVHDDSAELTSDAPMKSAEDGAAPRAGAEPPETGDVPTWRRALARFPLPIELVILTVLAAITRFAFLYNPRAIVFDEVYFREYALHYKAGTYYFDLHPPLGKLLFALWAAITGVDATATDKDPAVVMRILPAFAGTLLIVVVYLLIRKISGSRRVATLGAGLVLLENSILVESRFILMDSMLLLFGFTAVYLALKAREKTGRSYWLWFSGMAFFAGLALTMKLTGLAMVGLVGLIWLFDVVREKRWQNWKPLAGQAALLLIIPAFVYVTAFAVHFALLPKTGPGDAYMPQEFQATIKGNQYYDENADLSLFTKFKDLNSAIHIYEVQLNTSKHPYSSKWYSWPINKRGIYLYLGDANDGKSRYIYALGNPLIYWGMILGALTVAVGWIAKRKKFRPYRWAMTLLAIGWVANFLPFALIVRPMFLYHYFFALIFSIAFVTLGLGILLGWVGPGRSPLDHPVGAEADDEDHTTEETATAVGAGSAVDDATKADADPKADAERVAAEKAFAEAAAAYAKATGIEVEVPTSTTTKTKKTATAHERLPDLGPWAFPSRGSALVYWGILGVALLSFLYFLPISYGLPLSPDGLDSRMWLSSWR